MLPVEQNQLETLELLPLNHRDPFDRLIIAAAIANDYTLVSADENFVPYITDNLRVVS